VLLEASVCGFSWWALSISAGMFCTDSEWVGPVGRTSPARRALVGCAVSVSMPWTIPKEGLGPVPASRLRCGRF
jgi:hypothetical protein